VRQPQRDARQGRRADVPAPTGGLIDIRELTDEELGRIGDRLPLARLGGPGTYLVAWDGEEPVAHAHISWAATKLGVPEIQDVFVREDRRRQGLGAAVTLAAEQAVRTRGSTRISLGTSVDNEAARRLYEKLGYRDSGLEPERVRGTIMIRSGPLEVDDILIYLVKDLAVDFGRARSS
jgi:GNAT superfamily N-acetyltransferase